MRKSWTLAFVLIVCVFVALPNICVAQTTEFVYQGQLQNASVPANGNYDFEFLLFDALSGGTQVGSTLTRSGVAVAAGIFSVKLDFGANYPGANRFLDVHVRQSGGGVFTPLIPRQSVSSAPYAIRALTVTGPVTGANAVQTLLVTNSQPGVIDPSITNPPPTGLRAEATSTANSNAGVFGIADGANGTGVIGMANGSPKTDNATGVQGMATATSGNTVGVSGFSSSPDGYAIRAHSMNGAVLFDGSNDSAGHVFTVDAAGGLAAAQNRFTVDGNGSVSSLGTVHLAGGGFNVDANGNAVVAGTLTAMLPGGGSATMCVLGGSPILRLCSSSLRYKKQVSPFTGGLDIVNRLHPIAFKWKENNMNDLGLGAEDVAKIEPLLTTTNDKGEVEGVKYGQLNVVLINAVQEQQRQIDAQRVEIAELKRLVCRTSRAKVCRVR